MKFPSGSESVSVRLAALIAATSVVKLFSIKTSTMVLFSSGDGKTGTVVGVAVGGRVGDTGASVGKTTTGGREGATGAAVG